jgi:hypothetical protein
MKISKRLILVPSLALAGLLFFSGAQSAAAAEPGALHSQAIDSSHHAVSTPAYYMYQGRRYPYRYHGSYYYYRYGGRYYNHRVYTSGHWRYY